MQEKVIREPEPGAGALSLFLLFLTAFAIAPAPVWAETPSTSAPSRGQVVYIPAYSHVYRGNVGQPFYLTVMLSVRNTDPLLPLRLVDAEYRGSDGKLIRDLVKGPVSVGPLASTNFVIAESDVTGGAGASFLVTWRSERPINQPLMETVMVGTKSQQGVSFTSRGQVIKELSE